MSKSKYRERNYDASWMIPDEEAEFRWEQQEERSSMKCLREEEIIALASSKNQNTA